MWQQPVPMQLPRRPVCFFLGWRGLDTVGDFQWTLVVKKCCPLLLHLRTFSFLCWFCGRPQFSKLAGPDGADRRSPSPLRLICPRIRGLPGLQLWPTCKRRSPHKVVHPRSVPSRLCHHSDSEANHTTRRCALRHHRCISESKESSLFLLLFMFAIWACVTHQADIFYLLWLHW